MPKQYPSKEENNMRIHIFNSLEEENAYVYNSMCELSYENRMKNMEYMRRNLFHEYILLDGTWKPLIREFRIMEPYSNDVVK